ncbi:MAG: hypothetical protein KDA86_15730 [Planctomycetaceae bacterium]|nr:hypothetical protein [Planctomycetaceae bacterium]
MENLTMPGYRCGVVCLLMVCSAALASAQEALTHTTFDVDPGWEGFRNRLLPDVRPRVKQDFGYRATNYAGGDRPGEIGGTIQRSTTPARYSMAIDERTFDEPLQASGTFSVTRASGGSGVMCGWFNENSQGWRTSNSLGFRLDGNGGKYWVFYEYGTLNRRTGGGGAFQGERYQTTPTDPFLADGTPHHWSLTYTPQAGTHDAMIRFRIDDRAYEVNVPAEHVADGATFNRFGLWNVETGGETLDAYFDDFTVNGQHVSFDADPDWICEGNQAEFVESIIRPYHNYGFSHTSHAGGERGEIGGIVFRDEKPSYYAARTQPLSLEYPLEASGTVSLCSAGADSGVMLGWFDSASKQTKHTPEYEEHLPNVLGMMIEGPSRIGHVFRATYTTATGQSQAPINDPHTGELRPVILPNGATHHWAIKYVPLGENAGGRMTVTFDDTSHILDLSPEDLKAGASFDRFGVFNIQAGGHHVEVYVDDLTFTAAQMP